MKQQLTQVFKNDVFGSIRVKLIKADGGVEEPGFNLSDTCMSLGYTRKNSARKEYIRKDRVENIASKLGITGVSTVDTDVKITKDADFNNTYITEDAMYDLVFESDAAGAREFRHWVTKEVLPSIRENGAYITPEIRDKLKENPNYITDLIIELEDTNKQNEQLLHDYNDVRLMYQNTTNEVAEYVNTQVHYSKTGKVKCVDLYNHYFRWCRDNPHYDPYERKQFEQLLLERMVEGHSIVKDGNYYKWIEVR